MSPSSSNHTSHNKLDQTTRLLKWCNLNFLFLSQEVKRRR
ncbi:hypothetical protein SAMD00023518_00908 [Listeria monocytogenes]|nr:hypothetical protein SAMD00023518_00908 [Listeria monocytogenes]